MIGHARISDCGLYRYTLLRSWDSKGRNVCWVMLNPSTADAQTSDPTIRRCVGFTRDWGYGSLCVVNLYAYRATDPRQLDSVGDPVGPYNDAYIEVAAARADLVVAAWGAHVPGGKTVGAVTRHRERVEQVLRLLGPDVQCLGFTATGRPRHPLYVASDTRPIAMRSRVA